MNLRETNEFLRESVAVMGEATEKKIYKVVVNKDTAHFAKDNIHRYSFYFLYNGKWKPLQNLSRKLMLRDMVLKKPALIGKKIEKDESTAKDWKKGIF